MTRRLAQICRSGRRQHESDGGSVAEPGDDTEIETLAVGEISCYRVSGGATANGGSGNVLLEIHGGALIAGRGALCRTVAGRTAVRMGATVYAPDYRMPPLYPYPTPLDDCVAVYREVLSRHAQERIVVHGGSAGANVAAAIILRAKAEGLPLPAGLVLETPELDLTESGDSFRTNAIIDVVLQRGLGPDKPSLRQWPRSCGPLPLAAIRRLFRRLAADAHYGGNPGYVSVERSAYASSLA